jgi:hypothetical protein
VDDSDVPGGDVVEGRVVVPEGRHCGIQEGFEVGMEAM